MLSSDKLRVQSAFASVLDRKAVTTRRRAPRPTGEQTQTIGRAHAIKGFIAGRPLARERLANPALAMKKISDTTPPQDYRGHNPATGIRTL